MFSTLSSCIPKVVVLVLEVGSCDVVVGVVGGGGDSTTLHLAASSDIQVMIVPFKLTHPLLE